YSAVHAVVSFCNGLGARPVPSDGYSRPYVYAYALSQLAWASLGFWLLYLIAQKYFEPVIGALAVATAIFGTGLLRYTAADLMMSHAASFFSLTWCLYEALGLRAEPDHRVRWFRLGAASGLVVMTRLQNGVFLVVPFVAALQSSGRIARRGAMTDGLVR